MINPVREMYEMEFRQRDLANELERNRRVQLALGAGTRRAGRFLAMVGRFFRMILRPLNVKRDKASVDLNRPYLDGSIR